MSNNDPNLHAMALTNATTQLARMEERLSQMNSLLAQRASQVETLLAASNHLVTQVTLLQHQRALTFELFSEAIRHVPDDETANRFLARLDAVLDAKPPTH